MREDLQKQFEELQSILTATTRERDSLFAEIEASRERIRESSREADIFKSRLDETLIKLRDKENLLRTQNGQLTVHNSGINENIVKLEKRIDSLNIQLKNERESFLRQEQDLMRISEQNRQRSEQDRRECQRLEQELLTHRRDTVNFKLKIEEAEKHNISNAENIAELERQIAVLEKKLQAASENKQQLLSEHDNFKKKSKDTESELKGLVVELKLNLDEVQKKLGQENKKRAELESRFEAEKANFETLKNDFISKENNHLNRENQARETAQRYQSLLLTARHEFSELQVKFDRLERKHLHSKDEYKRDRTELLGEMRRLEKKLQSANDKLRETEKQITIEKRVASNQVDQLRAQIRNAISLSEREKTAMKQELDSLRDKAQEVQLRGENFDNEVAQIRQDFQTREDELNNSLAKKLDALKKTATAFEDETRRNQALEDQVISLRGLLEEMEKKLRLTQAQMQKDQKIFKKKLSGTDEQYLQLQNNLNQLNNECTTLNGNLLKAKDREISLRTTIKGLRFEMQEMQEHISASSASKAYLKEKFEAVDNARNEFMEKYQHEKTCRINFEKNLKSTTETYENREQKFKTEKESELKKIEFEHSKETAAYREEIETLTVERNNARRELNEEKTRNEEMLQNLLSMRDELEMNQEASNASKTYLKDKVKQLESKLEEYQNELQQEEKRRDELEQQLRELRRKMEFA